LQPMNSSEFRTKFYVFFSPRPAANKPTPIRFNPLVAPMSTTSLARSVTRINLAPTVSSLPSGVPKASFINLAAKAPHDAHAHGNHGPRADVPPSWAGGVKLRSGSVNGFASKTFVNGERTVCPNFDHDLKYNFRV